MPLVAVFKHLIQKVHFDKADKSFTETQVRLIEVNRQIALHRKALRTAVELTDEQRLRIEANRRVAIEKREAHDAKRE